ncbi:hypothetical protein B6S12_10765, partial [Helicobacter valdiviensis]
MTNNYQSFVITKQSNRCGNLLNYPKLPIKLSNLLNLLLMYMINLCFVIKRVHRTFSNLRFILKSISYHCKHSKTIYKLLIPSKPFNQSSISIHSKTLNDFISFNYFKSIPITIYKLTTLKSKL